MNPSALQKFDFSKADGFIYFINGKVIKYFADPEVTRKRCERARYLKGLVPEIESQKGSFFAYRKIDGNVLYSVLNTQVVTDFLYWAKTDLWKNPELQKEELEEFRKACRKFYKLSFLQLRVLPEICF